MAEQGQSGEKTEAPTPERIRKAREDGQVVMSQEVGSAVMLTALLGIMIFVCPIFLHCFKDLLIRGIASGSTVGGGAEGITSFLKTAAVSVCVRTIPVLIGLLILGCMSSVMVSGLVYSPKALKPKFESLDPIKGFKNLVSMQSLVKFLIGVTKLIVVLGVAWLYLQDKEETVMNLRWLSPYLILSEISRLILGLIMRVVVLLAVIAVLDYLFQKYSYTKKLKMSIQELKEERKQYETSPEVKGRMRAIQREMAQRRMYQEVPTADVVVVNPTHYAVAMKYDRDDMAAPQVIAKGVDCACARIKEIAKEHGVEIIERPELARALYRTVEIGQEIPEYLYAAVAEILAMLERIKLNRRLAKR